MEPRLPEPLAPVERPAVSADGGGATMLAEQRRGLSAFAEMGLRHLGETPP